MLLSKYVTHEPDVATSFDSQHSERYHFYGLSRRSYATNSLMAVSTSDECDQGTRG